MEGVSEDAICRDFCRRRGWFLGTKGTVREHDFRFDRDHVGVAPRPESAQELSCRKGLEAAYT
jgi:hypothetical protein